MHLDESQRGRQNKCMVWDKEDRSGATDWNVDDMCKQTHSKRRHIDCVYMDLLSHFLFAHPLKSPKAHLRSPENRSVHFERCKCHCPYILPSVLCVGKKVKRYIYKLRTTANKATMDEILIMYLLRKRKKIGGSVTDSSGLRGWEFPLVFSIGITNQRRWRQQKQQQSFWQLASVASMLNAAPAISSGNATVGLHLLASRRRTN